MRWRNVIAWAVCCGWALMACDSSECDQWQSFHNITATPCMSCKTMNCMTEQAAYGNAMANCNYDYSCVARCPVDSASSCGCIQGCLIDDACRTAYNDLMNCEVEQCESECR